MNAAFVKPVTIRDLLAKKHAGRPISMLTAYDASFARLIDATGIDCILVGDSLGNVVLGHATTLPVTVDDMLHHLQAVRRGTQRALLMVDMPFLSCSTRERTLAATQRLIGEGGAAMVKLEGGGPVVEQVELLSGQGVAVCAHLGLTPQHVHRLGGYRVQGREAQAREWMRAEALRLQEAGAGMLILECVPESFAGELAAELAIPVIGIGAGRKVDGQVLVLYDMLGLTPGKPPSFSRNFLPDSGNIQQALQDYVDAVHNRSFPDDQHVPAK